MSLFLQNKANVSQSDVLNFSFTC